MLSPNETYRSRSCRGLLVRGAVILLTASFSIAQTTNDELVHRFDPTKKFSITAFGMYVSSSELQNNPHSTDPIEKNAMIELDGGFGYGAEIGYNPGIFDSDIMFYVSSEYLKIDQRDLVLDFDDGTNHYSVGMREEFYMIPVEAGLKWPLPVSSEEFKIYIGGGAGMYFGDRKRTISYLQSSTINKIPGFSLNILAGVEYFVARNLSANLELKFREANFDVESKFNSNRIIIEDAEFELTNPFYSRLLAEGVRISAGFKYHF